LTVRARGDGKFDILAGQRRYLACKDLGMTDVAVILREEVSDSSAVALSLIENVQRADMHPLDKAGAFEELKTQYGGNLRKVAESTGVSVQTIQRYLTLLRLPDSLKGELGTQSGAAGVGAMAGIAKTFSNPDEMVLAWNQIGGFTQSLQGEILKRSGGDISALPELVLQAQEGAFEAKRCGSGMEDCPHIPEELRKPLLEAAQALEQGSPQPEQSLKEAAARHKKKA
jgi:ParB/RepB/Spo0J family partition protein